MGKAIGFLFFAGGYFTLRYFLYDNVLALYIGLPILIAAIVLLTLELKKI